MVRIYIELDKEKIDREGKYDYEKLQNGIDEIFAGYGSYKDSEGWYTNGKWETFAAIAAHFGRNELFLEHAKKFLWNNKDYEEGPDDIYIEDMLEEYKNAKKRGKI